MDVTAKTKDGKEIFTEQKIYMPQSPAYGRGDKMVYGPHRKSGMLADNSLQPGQTKTETIYIKFPMKEVEKDGKKMKELEAKEMDITVQLWYLPAGGDPKKGVVGKDQFLFFETKKSVSLK